MDKIHFSSKSDKWETPQKLFDTLNKIYHFDLDVCASAQNAKCKKFYSENGPDKTWHKDGYSIWMNPPYGREIGKWVRKAYDESLNGCFVVCLLPARTDTSWFHEYCRQGQIMFIRGRLKFSGSKNAAPFPSMLVMFGLEPLIGESIKP
mgnify:CR=1 FL=1